MSVSTSYAVREGAIRAANNVKAKQPSQWTPRSLARFKSHAAPGHPSNDLYRRAADHFGF